MLHPILTLSDSTESFIHSFIQITIVSCNCSLKSPFLLVVNRVQLLQSCSIPH
ncbi:hypothetical protein HanRHA438_Chr14g0632491 [Helianthus annuus]|uniref:Uncharacterized protein n=1 Tax=Helianthus annuus TaxID=4232 RepID=A0A251SEA0_HELAN|nr:hypothetical protein HanXRQr2_Chr14g0622491 [Helianthus annuus]KAJ0484217.1 hypothetical protein HanHA89_Chr14g0541631 [Helianthus annuus]KAJ0658517.1 hypothetical protein HanOQP8_Chr14g0509101 [Helianthus annuus]KAJ0851936.1 hypothetical protein HanRHA438_Chr14g0632491 [Helianthus annuus]